jgi:hypothetical protein
VSPDRSGALPRTVYHHGASPLLAVLIYLWSYIMSKRLRVVQKEAATAALKSYQNRVERFVQFRGGAVREAERDGNLAQWHFYQNMCEENEKQVTEAVNKYTQMGQDQAVYAELCELMVDGNFSSLDFVYRRALEVLKVFFAVNMPVEGGDGKDVKLREHLAARKAELSRLLNTSDEDELLAGTAAGVDKPFAESLLEVVIQRNELAVLRGYSNYYHMCMGDEETDYHQMRRQLNELKTALDYLFQQVKSLPKIKDKEEPFSLTNISGALKRPENILSRTGEVLGLSASSLQAILAASDIYPREKKNEHYFLFTIDSPNDVRALLNIPEDAEKIEAFHIQYQMLHEIVGHGIDYVGIRADLPSVLRSHKPFSTEVMALLAEKLPQEPRWLKAVCGVDARTIKKLQAKSARKELQSTLKSMRNSIVMVEFEMLMYENPTQDLDALFHKLMTWYYGYKIKDDFYARGYWSVYIPHYVQNPAYCHNYLLGKAWVMQVRAALRQKFGSIVSRRVGPYLAKRRRNGLLYTPEEQLVQITGEAFNCEAVIQPLTQMLSVVQKASQSKELASVA